VSLPLGEIAVEVFDVTVIDVAHLGRIGPPRELAKS
jgi:hypothetical protein